MDLTGKRFGRLLVSGKSSNYYITPSSGKRHARWKCLCDCGKETEVITSQLTSGKTQSCGCLQRERTASANTKHGGRYDRLHAVWANMKNRCYNKNYAEYSSYGGRGIYVCDEWQTYPPFRDWAVKAGYDSTCGRGVKTLDRIDVDSCYCPENCRFVDMNVQANNKQNNIRYKMNGQEHTLSEWSKILSVEYDYLYYRVRTKNTPLEEVIRNM